VVVHFIGQMPKDYRCPSCQPTNSTERWVKIN